MVKKKLTVSYLRIAKRIVATAKSKEEEVFEVKKSRRLDILALAERRLKRNGDQVID